MELVVFGISRPLDDTPHTPTSGDSRRGDDLWHPNA